MIDGRVMDEKAIPGSGKVRRRNFGAPFCAPFCTGSILLQLLRGDPCKRLGSTRVP